MRPIAELPAAVARRIRGVLTDIDGTLTDGGRLGPEAYAALWRLRQAGLWVIPVTGRPAGWCDLIARQWPVDAVVGENGALAYWPAGDRLERRVHPAAAEARAAERLDEVRAAVLAEVPGSRVAADQPFRQFDLAIDYREDPPDLGLGAAQQIRAVFERFGAHAKISDIHVNGWFGDYDKLSMVERVLAERFGIALQSQRDAFVYCGDSPNDEPMFAAFPNACAVANIAPFVPTLRHLPGWVTTASGGQGFAELCQVLLARRG